MLAALCAAVLLPGSAAATATGPVISEFDQGLTLGVGLWGITSGPDGNLWFTEETNNAVGRITPGAVITEFTAGFPTGSPQGIVTGPDGNLWVAMAGGDGAIAQVTKAGVVTEFPVPTPGDPTDIAVGPDKNLWYVDSAANLIGRITPEGSITEFSDGLSALSAPSSITKGPDGALWFTEADAGKIGRITTAGDITEFSSGISGSSVPKDIVTGPDGNLWFTMNADPGGIGMITPAGDITEFSSGLTKDSAPLGITAGADGNLWFTESRKPAIGRITTDGHITEYFNGLVSILNPWAITAGPDGNVWFTGNNPGLLGRITLPPLVRGLDADEITMTSARLRGKVRPNSQATEYWFEYGPSGDDDEIETETAYAGSGTDLTEVATTVEGLSPSTEYEFHLVAKNDAGRTMGPELEFKTASVPAEVAGRATHACRPSWARSRLSRSSPRAWSSPLRAGSRSRRRAAIGRPCPPAPSCPWARPSTPARATSSSRARVAAAARRPGHSAAASSPCASRARPAGAWTCTCAAGTSASAATSLSGVPAAASWRAPRAPSGCAGSGAATAAASSAATAGTATRLCAARGGSRSTAVTARSRA